VRRGLTVNYWDDFVCIDNYTVKRFDQNQKRKGGDVRFYVRIE